MNNYFNRETLMQSSIFELRNIARDIGVYSPTIYKKEELIDKIFEIVNGEVKPHVPKSKQGRPPKSLSLTAKKSMLDRVLPTELQYDMDEEESPCLVLSESVRAYLEDNSESAKVTFEVNGVLDITSFGYGFLREPNTNYTAFEGAYVSQNIIKQNNLKDGDKIIGKAKMLEENKPSVLFEIDSVEGATSILNFDKEPVSYSVMPLDFGEVENFYVGSANMLTQAKSHKKPIATYLNNLDSSRYTVLYTGLELNKEDELALKDFDFEKYYTLMTALPIEHIGLIRFVLARAKRLAQQGKDVVLVVDSLDRVIKNQNLANKKNIFDIDQNTLNLVKDLAMASRQFAKVGSFTVIGSYNYQEHNTFDQNIIGEIENYFSKVYNAGV